MALLMAGPQVEPIQFQGSDFLKAAAPWYAGRARRKKISLFQVEARNGSAAPLTIDFARARLRAGGREHAAERGEDIARALATFQWDFLFYWLLHFSLWELAVELALFLAGGLFNRRLRRGLRAVLDRPVTLLAGEKAQGLLAFRMRPGEAGAELELPWSQEGSSWQWARCRL
jgi:hypothetical protein